MPNEQFANNAETTLSADVDIGDTTISVASADSFPSQVIFRVRVGSELMLVTGFVSATVWTVERGWEGTTEAAHSTDDDVTLVVTAEVMDELADLIRDQAVHTFLAGPVLGLAGSPGYRFIDISDLPAETGTVQSVGLVLPDAVFDVTNTPITTTGDLTAVFKDQAANLVFAGPESGSDDEPAFRALVMDDLPDDVGTVTSVGLELPDIFSVTGSPVTGSGTLTAELTAQPKNLVFAGPEDGSDEVPAFRALVLDDLPEGVGAVTSVDASGGSTGLSFSGGPIIDSGVLTLSGTLVAANGGTGISSYTVGDMLYASGSATLSKLAGVATGNALISGGTGTAPSWGKVGLSTHVSGTLPLANGGTGATTAADARTNLGLGTLATANSVNLAADVTGALPVSNGGTGQTSASAALNALLPSQTGNTGKYLQTDGSSTSWSSVPTGTVTSVSVVTANGVSGSVATATTTPAITLTLGAITPSSVAASGTVTGSNLSGTSSGTNTGDQTISLTGDVTGTGTCSFAATIANNAVTNAKLATMSTGRIKGNNAGSSGNPIDLTAAEVTEMLPVFTPSGTGHAKGLVPDPGSSAGATKFLREDSSWATPPGTSYSAGDGLSLVGSEFSLDAEAALDLLSVFQASGTGHEKGLVPDPGGSSGTSKYLREDATWQVPPNTTYTAGTGLSLSSNQFSIDSTVVTLTGTQTLTNKSIVATQLTGTLQAAQFPALTGHVTTTAGSLTTTIASGVLTTANFATNVVDTDATLAANSDTRIPSQKAVKTYVDNLVTGLAWKQAVRVATTTNGAFTTAFQNGSSVDGVTLATNDRILIKNQTDGTQNGIYTVNASGSPSRTTDADTGSELVSATVLVRSGTTNADTQWTCTNDSITIGTTSIVFVQISGAGTYTAGTGLALTGNQFSIDSTVVTLTGTQTLTNKSMVATQLTGTLQADQFPALTGDVTTSAGSLSTTVVSASDTAAGKIEIAVQSEQEAGTDTTRAVTPGRQQYHPSAAKAWVKFSLSGTSVTVHASYNIASVTRTSTGVYEVTFSTAFSSAHYAVTCSAANINGTGNALVNYAIQTASTCQIVFTGATFTTVTDGGANISAAFFGDQ